MKKPNKEFLPKTSTGISIIEVLMAFAGVGILALLFSNTISQLTKGKLRMNQAYNVMDSVERLGAHILRIGRVAGADQTSGPTYHRCSVLTAPARLLCEVDLNSPPTGILSTVQFRYDSTTKQVLYETLLSGTTFRTDLTYDYISEFILCGDSAGCSLLPAKISTEYQAYLVSAGLNNIDKGRFVRFRLVGAASSQTGGEAIFQSAFYTRNPARFDTAFKYAK